MSTSPYLFADLASAETQAIIRARLVAALAADGLPVDSWAPSSAGGEENLRLDMVAGGLQRWMAQRYAAAVRGRLLLTASDDPQLGAFLSYLGRKNYQLPRQQPTFTVQSMALIAAASAAAADYADGQLVVRAPGTGNRYVLELDPGVTIHVAPGAITYGPFQAENPGSSYADPAGTVTQMVTAKAGLSCINAPPLAFLPTTSSGVSTGIMGGFNFSPSTEIAYSVVRVRIETTGDVGTATFSVSTDGGLTYVFAGTLTGYNVPGGGTLVFKNGVGTPNSFMRGSIFSAIVDSAIIARGRDLESATDYQQRCSNRWPALSLVPVKGTIEIWSKFAASEVTKVASRADPNTANGILVTLASQSGPATPAAQQAVQAFITARLGFRGMPAPVAPTVPGSASPEETVLTAGAVDFPVTVGGTVYVPRAQFAAAQAAVDEPWDEYVDGLPMGGEIGALVELIRLETLLGDLGAQDVQGLTLNGVAADLVVPVSTDATPAAGSSLVTNLIWVPV